MFEYDKEQTKTWQKDTVCSWMLSYKETTLEIKFVSILDTDSGYWDKMTQWQDDVRPGLPLPDNMVSGLIHVKPSGPMATVSGTPILGSGTHYQWDQMTRWQDDDGPG